MGWNPYTDQKNKAYSNILTTLFPEQTKTLPRIIVWSIICMLDLILIVGGAVYFGLFQLDKFNSMNSMMLAAALLVVAVVGIFWLQGKIWESIIKFFEKRKELG